MTDEPKKIVIDLAGAMDKITPEMMDQARDLMIDTLMKRCTEMREALELIVELAGSSSAVQARIKEVALGALPK